MRKIKRFFQLFSDRLYRDMIMARVFLGVSKKLYGRLNLIGIADGTTQFLCYTQDRAISLHALSEGFFHRQEMDRALTALQNENLLRPGVFVEIGGNIGTSSIAALQTNFFSQLLCFEPSQANCRLIKANLALNDLLSKVILIPKAVSNRMGEAELLLSSKNFGDHQVLSHGKQDSQRQREIIQLTTLTQELKNHNLHGGSISVIWVDTQGHEGYVLEGAQDLLQLRQVPWIVEYWPNGMEKSGCYTLFHELVNAAFNRVVDIHTGQSLPIKDIKRLEGRLTGITDFTDILLVP